MLQVRDSESKRVPSESDIYRRQILTCKVPALKSKIFIIAANLYHIQMKQKEL